MLSLLLLLLLPLQASTVAPGFGSVTSGGETVSQEQLGTLWDELVFSQSSRKTESFVTRLIIAPWGAQAFGKCWAEVTSASWPSLFDERVAKGETQRLATLGKSSICQTWDYVAVESCMVRNHARLDRHVVPFTNTHDGALCISASCRCIRRKGRRRTPGWKNLHKLGLVSPKTCAKPGLAAKNICHSSTLRQSRIFSSAQWDRFHF